MCLFTHSAAHGQLSVTPSASAAQMANALAGPGITIVNATYTGSAAASGLFSTTPLTVFGMQSGVIITTGIAQGATGPNTQSGYGATNQLPGDSLLSGLMNGVTLYDASALLIEFIPSGDTLKFEFIFGSEEYPEFAGSNFQDVFGAFINGLNPTTMMPYLNKNIALVPGTNSPISISTINNGTSNAGPCINCAYYVNNTAGVWIQYDGITSVITASIPVVPMTVYTLRLAIADVGDMILDSGVFLKGGSLISMSTGGVVKHSGSVFSNKALEGCSNALVEFNLGTPHTDTVVVHLDSIYGSAIQGVDYPSLPQNLLILPGQQKTQLVIAPFDDQVTEGDEQIMMDYSMLTNITGTLTVNIGDYRPMQLTMSGDTTVGCSSPVQLSVQPVYGLPPYHYIWSPSQPLDTNGVPNPVATPVSPTLFSVTIYDSSGCGIDSGTVNVKLNLVSLQPQDQVVPMESDAAFTVSCDDSLATYQWQLVYKDTVLNLMLTGTKYTGNHSKTLTVFNVNINDTICTYRCKISSPPCTDYSLPAKIILTAGISSHPKDDPVKIFPNPTSGVLFIETDLYPATLQLTDLTGRILREADLQQAHYQLDISDIKPGLYGLHITSSPTGWSFTGKIIRE